MKILIIITDFCLKHFLLPHPQPLKIVHSYPVVIPKRRMKFHQEGANNTWGNKVLGSNVKGKHKESVDNLSVNCGHRTE